MSKRIENFPKGDMTELKDRVIIMKISDEGRTRFPDVKKDEYKQKVFDQIKTKRKDVVSKISKTTSSRGAEDTGIEVGTDRPIVGIDLFDNRFRYYHPWGFNHTLVNKDGEKAFELKEDGFIQHDNSEPFKGADKIVRRGINGDEVDPNSNYNRQGWEHTNANSELKKGKLVWSTGVECPRKSIIILVGRIGHVLLHDIHTGRQLNNGMEPGLYEVSRIVPHDPVPTGTSPPPNSIPPYRNLPKDPSPNLMYPNEYYLKPEPGARNPTDMPYKVEVRGTDKDNNPINEIHELPGAKALLSDLLSYGTTQNQPKENRVFILLRGKKEKLTEGRVNSANHVQVDISPYGKVAPFDYSQNCKISDEEDMSIKDYAQIIFYPNMLNLLVKGMINFDSRPSEYGSKLVSKKELEIIKANTKEDPHSLNNIPIKNRIGAPVLLYQNSRYENGKPFRLNGICSRDMPCNFIQLCNLVQNAQSSEFYGGIDLQELKDSVCDHCEGKTRSIWTRAFGRGVNEALRNFKTQKAMEKRMNKSGTSKESEVEINQDNQEESRPLISNTKGGFRRRNRSRKRNNKNTRKRNNRKRKQRRSKKK